MHPGSSVLRRAAATLLVLTAACRSTSEPTATLQGAFALTGVQTANATWTVSDATLSFQDATRTYELRLVQQPPAQHLAPQGTIPAGTLVIRGTYAMGRGEAVDLTITSATTAALDPVPGTTVSGRLRDGRVRIDWRPVATAGAFGPQVSLDFQAAGS